MTEEAKIVSGNEGALTASAAIAGSHPFRKEREKDGAPTSKKPADKKEESDSAFAVAVTDVYEGPLDLLLDLIRKQDIDI